MVCWQAMIGNNQEVAQKKNKKNFFAQVQYCYGLCIY